MTPLARCLCVLRYCFALMLVFAVAGLAAAADPSVQDKQNAARKAAQDTLNALYQAQPAAKAAVERAAGYAAFNSLGVKILLAGSGNGSGVAVNNKTGKQTFMKMLEVQAGLGLGIKQYRVIFVFETEKALNSFINQGWDFSGQAAVAAKAGGMGEAYQGALSVAPGVWLYQLTENGLAAELSVKGTKYYKDTSM